MIGILSTTEKPAITQMIAIPNNCGEMFDTLSINLVTLQYTSRVGTSRALLRTYTPGITFQTNHVLTAKMDGRMEKD